MTDVAARGRRARELASEFRVSTTFSNLPGVARVLMAPSVARTHDFCPLVKGNLSRIEGFHHLLKLTRALMDPSLNSAELPSEQWAKILKTSGSINALATAGKFEKVVEVLNLARIPFEDWATILATGGAINALSGPSRHVVTVELQGSSTLDSNKPNTIGFIK